MCQFCNNLGMENMVLVKVKDKTGFLFNIVLKQLKVEYWSGNSSWPGLYNGAMGYFSVTGEEFTSERST